VIFSIALVIVGQVSYKITEASLASKGSLNSRDIEWVDITASTVVRRRIGPREVRVAEWFYRDARDVSIRMTANHSMARNGVFGDFLRVVMISHQSDFLHCGGMLSMTDTIEEHTFLKWVDAKIDILLLTKSRIAL
jgi:hypothetical protein